MKLMRTPDLSLLVLDDITAQVCMAKPRGCKPRELKKKSVAVKSTVSLRCITVCRPNLRSVKDKL